MVIFLNLDGTAEKVTPKHVYQGSNNVTDITVIAPYAADTAMEIGFILPDGLYWQNTSDGARCAPMNFVGQNAETKACAWTFTLPLSITEQQGIVQIAINAKTIEGNTTSYLCEMTVEESVLPNLPSAPEPSVYELLQLYLSRLDGRTANVPNLVKSIQKVDGIAFTYTDNKGVVSAPITLGEIDYSPTYVGAASVISVPVSAWQPVYSGQTVTGYTLTISAAQHGQMQDGATAHDLWLSFDSMNNEVIAGAYQGYTVSEAGDITLNVNTPIAMTVRIWNGKGLVDTTARAEIAAETARAEAVEQSLKGDITTEIDRAEAAENGLQKQIDHIVDTGIDKLARQQIAAETERAEAAEQQLGSRIAENSSGVQSLQQDVEKIESFIPSTTSEENQLADKAFVNSSINNMAAFYITSNADGEAFPTRASLFNASTYYFAGQPRTPTKNDYAIVLQDETQPKSVDGTYPTTRYMFDGVQWDFQYVVNNTALTQAQVDAINSGITKELVTQIGENKSGLAAESTARVNADANLQEQINAIGSAGVTSVNGQTGAVSITPESIGAIPQSGDSVKEGNFTIIGNSVVEGNFTVNWLQAVSTSDLGAIAPRYAVFREDGWLYFRTADEVKDDLGINHKVSKTGNVEDRRDTPGASTEYSDRTFTPIFGNQNSPYSGFGAWYSGFHINGWNPSEGYCGWDLIGFSANTNKQDLPLYVRGSYKGNVGQFRKIYDTANPPTITKKANTMGVGPIYSQPNFVARSTYSLSALNWTVNDPNLIGGLIVYGNDIVGYIISATQFVALKNWTVNSGGFVYFYYTEVVIS